MSRDTCIIDRVLLENLVHENIRLRAKVEELEKKEPLVPQVMESQISIEEYMEENGKKLTKKRKVNENKMFNKKDKKKD